MGAKEFKISLFAADVVLFVSNPIHYHCRIWRTFQICFIKFQGSVLTVRNQKLSPFLFPIILSSISKSNFAMLGLQLETFRDPNPTNVQKRTKMSKAHQTNETLNLQWPDRINIVKSFLFPNFLYLFRMLPICLHEANIRKWQTLFSIFIWSVTTIGLLLK